MQPVHGVSFQTYTSWPYPQRAADCVLNAMRIHSIFNRSI